MTKCIGLWGLCQGIYFTGRHEPHTHGLAWSLDRILLNGSILQVKPLNISRAEERSPDVVASDIKAPSSQRGVEAAPSAALRLPPVRLQQLCKADSGSPSSSARIGMDLPPGTPLSNTGRSEGRAGAYMDVRMAFTGVQTNPLQTMRELPSEAAAAIIKSMRLPVQLYLESFLGELWNEVSCLPCPPWASAANQRPKLLSKNCLAHV